MRPVFKTSLNITSNFFKTMTDTKSAFFNAVYRGDVPKVDEMLKAREVTVEMRNDDDCTPLHVAAHGGRFKLVKYLIDEHKADVNVKNKQGKVPLEDAVDKYEGAIARYLVKHNSEKPEYINKLKNPPEIEELVTAAENNDIAKVTELLKPKPDNVNSVDKADNNRSLLHLAAKYNYLELAKVLVEEFKADVDLTDDIGDCPLYTAMAFGNDEVANYLNELDVSDDDEEIAKETPVIVKTGTLIADV